MGKRAAPKASPKPKPKALPAVAKNSPTPKPKQKGPKAKGASAAVESSAGIVVQKVERIDAESGEARMVSIVTPPAPTTTPGSQKLFWEQFGAGSRSVRPRLSDDSDSAAGGSSAAVPAALSDAPDGADAQACGAAAAAPVAAEASTNAGEAPDAASETLVAEIEEQEMMDEIARQLNMDKMAEAENAAASGGGPQPVQTLALAAVS